MCVCLRGYPWKHKHNFYQIICGCCLWSRVQSSDRGASAFHDRIISNNPCAHDEQGVNPGQEKEGSTVSSIICDRVADTLSSSVKAVSRAGAAEAERRGWPLTGAAHSTSQG